MSGCEVELCRNWAGSGCVCEVLDLEPDVVCGSCGGFGCAVCVGEDPAPEAQP